MQRIWAVTQCVGIDAGMSGTIIRAFSFHAEGQKVMTWLYGLLSVLLLFTAIVLNIESVQQTLNLTLEKAYVHVFVPVKALIWIRSIAIVLLIVAYAMRHVSIGKSSGEQEATQPQTPAFVISPELLATLRGLLQTTSVQEEQAGLPLLLTEGQTQEEEGANNGERVKAYLADHPKAPLREIAEALTISVTTARKWRSCVQGEGVQVSAKK